MKNDILRVCRYVCDTYSCVSFYWSSFYSTHGHVPQDTKNTGELFGIGNLLKDLSDEVFTSNIIEDDKILSIQPDVAVKEITSKKLHLRGLKRQVQVNDSQDEHGLVALAQLIQEGAKVAEGQQLAKSEKSCAEERRPLKERLPEVLINTGTSKNHFEIDLRCCLMAPRCHGTPSPAVHLTMVC